MMALKERIMQERNDARKEKARLEGEIVSNLFSFLNHGIHSLRQATTTKQYDEQDTANQILKK
jgi:hypothetical protein